MLSLRAAKNLCIKPDWVWNNIIEDISSGEFAKNLAAISESINSSLEIIVQATPIKDKDSVVENFEGLELNNIVTFTFDGKNFECIKEEAKGEMRSYTNIDSIEGLLEIFKAKDMEWFWIDVYVVVDVENLNANKLGKVALAFVEKYKEIF